MESFACGTRRCEGSVSMAAVEVRDRNDLTQGSWALITQQTCRGSLSAVSKPIFDKSICRMFNALQSMHTFAALQTRYLRWSRFSRFMFALPTGNMCTIFWRGFLGIFPGFVRLGIQLLHRSRFQSCTEKYPLFETCLIMFAEFSLNRLFFAKIFTEFCRNCGNFR